jgi:hypothetical protein
MVNFVDHVPKVISSMPGFLRKSRHSVPLGERMNLHRIVLATLFACAVAVGLVGMPTSAQAQAAPDPWLILATGKSGPINAHTTRNDLVRTYGAANVEDQDVDVGEGETVHGTALFPNDPGRFIQIIWGDAEKKAAPKTLTIRGNKSRWKTLHDISLGTSLKQLEQLNGKPFHMSGYGWDYEGTIMSWDNGTLARDLGEASREHGEQGRIILRLTCGTTGTEPLGDRDFTSSDPILQKANPCVGEMVWVFP